MLELPKNASKTWDLKHKVGTPQKILLIQLRRIGDVLMTTPSIRALRDAFPQARITFLTEPPSDQVLQYNTSINHLILHHPKAKLKESVHFLYDLYQQHFDLVIDFFGNTRSALMSWVTRAPYRIGFNFRGRRWLYNHYVPLGKEAVYAAQHKSLLVKCLGVSVNSFHLDFPINQTDRNYADQLFHQFHLTQDDCVVSLSPVSRQPYKVWNPERFAQIADCHSPH